MTIGQRIELNDGWLIRADAANIGVHERWFDSAPTDPSWIAARADRSAHMFLGDDFTGVCWYARRIERTTTPDSASDNEQTQTDASPTPSLREVEQVQKAATKGGRNIDALVAELALQSGLVTTEELAWATEEVKKNVGTSLAQVLVSQSIVTSRSLARLKVQLQAERAAERWMLRFESIATEATAWVNGIEIGRHVGDYLPVEFDVTAAMQSQPGPALVVIRVDQWHAPRPKPGTLTENGHITKGFHDVLSKQHAGLWCGASIRTTGPAAIAPDGVRITTPPVKGTDRWCARIRVKLDKPVPNSRAHAVVADADGRRVTDAAADISTGSCELHVELDAPELWSPAHPSLYHATVVIDTADVRSDSAMRHFGFRCVSTGGEANSNLLLNGKPILIRGVLDWGHEPTHIAPAPTPDEVRETFVHLREQGFNTVCLCMWYAPEWYYDIADEVGMMLWQEHPVWKSPMGDEHIPEYQRLFERFFTRDASHPSVIMVSGACEHEAFNPTLAAWWWERANDELPDRVLQVQTAFMSWVNPAQTHLYDEHIYDNSGRWMVMPDDVSEAISLLPPKPFIMGETIIGTSWPDLTRIFDKLGASRPWWSTRGLDACAAFEAKILDRYGLGTLDRFREQSVAHEMSLRATQCKRLRSMPGVAGWVMNHLRDVPVCRCGFQDETGEWRFQQNYVRSDKLRGFLADIVTMLSTPDHARVFRVGADIPVRLGVSNFASFAQTSHLRLEIAADRMVSGHSVTIATDPGDIRWAEPELIRPSQILKDPIDGPTRVELMCLHSFPMKDRGPSPQGLEALILVPDGLTEFPPGWARLDGLPLSEPERQPIFEERAYSSGWGLACTKWKPRIPDATALAFKMPLWRFDAPMPRSTRAVLTTRLTRSVLDFVESGGRALLLAGRCRGGMNAEYVNYWGQCPLVIERNAPWPVRVSESDWIVEALHLDLSRYWTYAVPVEKLGIADRVDPIVRCVFTHDSGTPKCMDVAFATKVGAGILAVSSLDHTTDAGAFFLRRMIEFVDDPKAMLAPWAEVTRAELEALGDGR